VRSLAILAPPDRSGVADGIPGATRKEFFMRHAVGKASQPTTVEMLKRVADMHEQFHFGTDMRGFNKACSVVYARVAQHGPAGNADVERAIGVAAVLAALGMDTGALASALEYDPSNDSGYSLELLRRDFGPEVAKVADWAGTAEPSEVRQQLAAVLRTREFEWMPRAWPGRQRT
jgi:(p)ppGpp synthase/HD superfamily hydrolase